MPDPALPFSLDPYHYDGPGDYEPMDQDTFDAPVEEAAGWVEFRRQAGCGSMTTGTGVRG